MQTPESQIVTRRQNYQAREAEVGYEPKPAEPASDTGVRRRLLVHRYKLGGGSDCLHEQLKYQWRKTFRAPDQDSKYTVFTDVPRSL